MSPIADGDEVRAGRASSDAGRTVARVDVGRRSGRHLPRARNAFLDPQTLQGPGPRAGSCTGYPDPLDETSR
jgi:hypothetical protein